MGDKYKVSYYATSDNPHGDFVERTFSTVIEAVSFYQTMVKIGHKPTIWEYTNGLYEARNVHELFGENNNGPQTLYG